MCNQGFVFCEKVKERLCSSDDYQAFLKCLNIYSNGIIKRNDLQNLVCCTPSIAVIFLTFQIIQSTYLCRIIKKYMFHLAFCLFQVTDLLGKYPDLMNEFNQFLERCEHTGNCLRSIIFELCYFDYLSFWLFLI